MILTILLFLVGLGVLLKGADWLVSGASALARRFKVSPLIIGVSVVAIGTSLPELFVSVVAVLSGSSDISVSNVIGSNICNIALVLGIASLISPLLVSKKVFKIHMPVVFLTVFLLWLFGRNYILSRGAGVVFLILFLAYFGYLVLKRSAPGEEVSEAMTRSEWIRKVPVVAILLGFLGIVLGAKYMVDYGVKIARFIGVSEAIVGLTMIAVGTSLPELATSVVAVAKHEHDISVGNILGSNIFNIILVLGCVATTRPVAVATRLFRVDFWVMLGYTVVLFPLLFTGYKLSRKEGSFLLITYIAYIVYLYYH